MSAGEYRQRFGTRWNDNDAFGHINNTIYYAAMDTTITSWLLGDGTLEIDDGSVIAVVVSSSCEYRESVSFPDAIIVSLKAGRIGTTSVTWQLEMFRESDNALVAVGTFVHVILDGASRRPIAVPAALRAAIERNLLIAENID